MSQQHVDVVQVQSHHWQIWDVTTLLTPWEPGRLKSSTGTCSGGSRRCGIIGRGAAGNVGVFTSEMSV